jgi:hypothetical protein
MLKYKLRVVTVALVASFALSGCSKEQDVKEGPSSEDILHRKAHQIGMMDYFGATQEQVDKASEAEQVVHAFLKDSDSARFQQIIVSVTADCVTGEVNAKNGFGGYGGFQTFAMTNGKISIGDDRATTKASTACINANTADLERSFGAAQIAKSNP